MLSSSGGGLPSLASTILESGSSSTGGGDGITDVLMDISLRRLSSEELSYAASFSAIVSFCFRLLKHTHKAIPTPSRPSAAPAIAIPTSAPVEIEDPSLGGTDVSPTFVTPLGVVVTVRVGCVVVLATENDVVTTVLAMARELETSPTLPGPLVEPSSALMARRYSGAV
jgi:hypothetical protein